MNAQAKTVEELGLGWVLFDEFCEEQDILGKSVFLNGFAARNSDRVETFGSTAQVGQFNPRIAEYELLERIVVLESGQKPENAQWKEKSLDGAETGQTLPQGLVFPHSDNPSEFSYSKSNGVALHSSWGAAAHGAVFELVERQSILMSWLGWTKPVIWKDVDQLQDWLGQTYDIYWAEFDPLSTNIFKSDVASYGVFLFPKDKGAPLVYGFGSHLDPAKAKIKAKNEAVQRLGFLWGEEIPQDPPDFSPTPLFHQDFYLYEKSHDLVLKWLHGDYFEPSARSHIRLEIQLVDLSLPEMSKEFCVANP